MNSFRALSHALFIALMFLSLMVCLQKCERHPRSLPKHDPNKNVAFVVSAVGKAFKAVAKGHLSCRF